MISEFIFSQIKLAIPQLTIATETKIFPQVIKEGTKIDFGVIYNTINTSIKYQVLTNEVQLTVFAKTYTECEELSYKVAGIFANKTFATIGDPLTTNTIGLVELPYDEKNKIYTKAVSIVIKSKKAFENFL
jgi:hypothetical protein